MNALVKRRHFIIALVAAALVAVLVVRGDGGFPLDDSWIHQAYGRNLGERGEWALVAGQPSAASTAPLYTVLLAVGYALRIPYLLWTHTLGTLALIGIGWAGAGLVAAFIPQRHGVNLWIGLLLVTEWHLGWAAAAGMETALFALWTLVLPLLTWQEITQDRPNYVLARGFGLGVIAGCATLTRPEGSLMVGLCALLWLVMKGRHTPRTQWQYALGVSLGFIVLVAPYTALNWQLTGGLLPNTSAAKQIQHAPLLSLPLTTRLWMMLQPTLVGGQALLIPGMAVLLWRVRQRREFGLALILLTWSLGLVTLYALRLPASYQHGRYVIPAIPALIVLGGVGSVWLLELARRTLGGRVLSRGLMIAATLIFAVLAIVTLPNVYAQDVSVIQQEMVASARWIDAYIPLDELLAIHDIGAVAYFTPRPLLDIAGLVSPEVIPLLNDPKAVWDLMEARGAVYLMAFPDQVPGDDPTDPRLCSIFITNGEAAPRLGGANMSIYRLAWSGSCGGS